MGVARYTVWVELGSSKSTNGGMAGSNIPTRFATPVQMLNSKSDLVLSPLFSPLSFSGCADERMSKRQKIVKEIFESEQTYISQIHTIVKLFLEPIRVNCLIPSEAIQAIFNNIEGILAVNTELIRTMRQHSVGEAFTHLGPFMKLYSSYSSNYHNALQVLEKFTKSDSKFSGFIETQESRPECCYLKLSAMLITPIQRIPRYKLLLDELLKHTKVTHLEYSKLNGAAQQIEVVAVHMNDYIKQLENANKMLTLQKKFTGSFIPAIIVPGRRFIKEGRLMKVCKRKPKERIVILFSDMLLYARPNLLDFKTETYTCRGFLPLLSSDLRHLNKDIRVPGITTLLQIASIEKSVTFFSYKKNEVLEWIELLENTIKDLQLSFASFLIPPPSHVHTITMPDFTRISDNSTNQTIIDSNFEASYPLTPCTPISNLARQGFFADQTKYEREIFMEESAAIPTATEIRSSEKLLAPRRTISQNLRELRSITEGQELMREIDTEIVQRHRGNKKKLISDRLTSTGKGNPVVMVDNESRQESPLNSTVDDNTREHLIDGDNDNKQQTIDNEINHDQQEEEHQPLLQTDEDPSLVSHHSSISSSSLVSGAGTTKCCVIL